MVTLDDVLKLFSNVNDSMTLKYNFLANESGLSGKKKKKRTAY